MLPMKNWAWTGIDRDASTDAVRAKYRNLKARGLHGVFLDNGIDEREFELVLEAGLELHCWMWTTNRRDQWVRDNHPEWYQVSRSGKSCYDQPPYVDYYRWLSPANPEVQTYIAERAEELASHPAVSGVHLDYVRYPDVILPRGLWGTYGLDQTEELPDYDFCYSEATRAAFKAVSGRDPLEIENPANDQEWLHFRYDTVTALVKRIKGVVAGHGKQLTAAVFPTPSMARKICRQDWDKWPLDAVCPMVYQSFYLQPISWIGEAMRENIQAVRCPVYPGLYLPDLKTPAELGEAITVALLRGASGVSLFGLDCATAEYWEALERATDQALVRSSS